MPNQLRNASAVTILALPLIVGVWLAQSGRTPESAARSERAGRLPLRFVALQAGDQSQVDDQQAANKALEEMPCSDWEKPAFALFCTGRQHGYIEPCGCTGLENAKGGFSRRHTFLKSLRDKGWDIIALDVGNQVRRLGAQAELKLQTTCNLLRELDYTAVGLGPDDLRLSIGELAAAIAGDGDPETAIFTCANANLFDVNSRYRIVEIAGRKIGIVAILGEEFQQQINSDEITFMSPDDGIRDVLPELKEARVNHLILLAHTTTKDTKRLAKAFPYFELILTAGGAGEPTLEPETVEGSNAQIVQVGTKGMYVGVVGYYPERKPPFRYERVELDARFKDSDIVMENFALYQRQLQDEGLGGLGLRPIAHPTGRTFAGHEACGDCHTTAYEIFEKTPHFHATDSISKPTERSDIPRHHDPECLSCHVTGWSPQGYFPYESGYLDLVESKHLHTNGCENCHGPGSMHVDAENGDIDATDEELDEYRLQMRVTVEQVRETCESCHDIDNSPDFDFDGSKTGRSYWDEVKHYGKD